MARSLVSSKEANFEILEIQQEEVKLGNIDQAQLEKKPLHRRKRFQNRSRTSLIASILSMAKDRPIARTHLMYRCNLSHRMLEMYVSYLIRAGLLESPKAAQNSKRALYRTTGRGKDYLNAYNSLLELTGVLSRSYSDFENLPVE